ncbi:MAG: transcription antitermination factor NusB [Candidatus Carbobacillus altaicus]|uniref:Transcription antitermination protein NusB n=1 Tax=Candidatus Carbonibacillus altaicus TaxID=2163959 RepID=A0A2R6Y399_9BACL|nr:transcription antitermination factor NusB [Candidatus Carbobacillus altaicus]PTQ57149.1 MAG: Transcription termination protein NusB [Candidatus Carbobacillus altaicus]
MKRQEARVLALQALYQMDLSHISMDEALLALGLSRKTAPYVVTILEGWTEHRDEIDELIKTHLVGWEWDRLPAVDRAILRIALFELLYVPEVPKKVVIDEAVELAKTYSDERARIFINGVLASVVKDERTLRP